MCPTEDAQIRHVYERWHDTLMSQDLVGLMALYAEHAVFESPPSWRSSRTAKTASCAARSEIEKLFACNFTNLKTEFSELYRSGLFFSHGRLLTWEYPRRTASGSTQVDLFESMDIENGLIVYHRVYWGWQGFKALLSVRERRRADNASP